MKNTKIITRLMAASLSAVLLFTGCGLTGSNKTFATLNDQKITMGFANFAAHYQQATYDQLYVDFVGEDYWSQDLYGSGNDMETDIKAQIADSIRQMYILDNHKDEYGISISADEQKKIDDAVVKFMAANSKKALDKIGATDEYVAEYLRLALVSTKMEAAVKKTLDPGYTMEDAAQKGITYVAVSQNGSYDDEGNPVEYTDEEKAAVKTAVEELAKVKPEELETKSEEKDYTAMPVTFGEDDTVVPDVVKEAVASLEVGQMSGVLDDGDRYYLVRYDSEYDEEATKEHLETMTLSAEDEAFNELMTQWGSECTWEINTKEWDKVRFNFLFTAPQTEEENAEG